MAPLKLYGAPLSPNFIRVASALNEKGLDYELVRVDLGNGAQRQPDFLALNPFGKVPVLQDGEETLFESRAINRYIATKYKSDGPDLLPEPSSPVEVWMEVESQHFHMPALHLVYQLVFKPMRGTGPPDAAVVDEQTQALCKVLDVYEARLSQSKYLAGDAFTLADLNHLALLFYLGHIPKAVELFASRPHVKAWWDDIAARPAWKKTADAVPYPTA